MMKEIPGEIMRDFSTEYTYDRNANLTSMMRKGITDVIQGGATRLFGVLDELTMTYDGNRINGIHVQAQGSDYEGRTGMGAMNAGGPLYFDTNGNMVIDESRNIVEIKYNRRNLPVRVTFGDGHRQTITYDAFGRKLRTEYSQVPEAMLTGNRAIYSDSWYQLTSVREYVGPHVFIDGKLEYSAFEGGYFDPDKGAMYYVTDWQGNNAAVVDKSGSVVQQTIYYPYGEPTIEPAGQRYLFGGKEREHAGGRNSYDFGARSLTPYGRWAAMDSESESFYPYSPYTYCAGDPINYVDPDGKWKIRLFKNTEKNRDLFNNTKTIGYDDKIHIIGHGYTEGIDYEKKKIYLRSGKDLLGAIEAEFKDVSKRESVDIILHSCHTGENDENGCEPIAQTMSRDIPNGVITAPNGILVVDGKGKQKVYIIYDKDNPNNNVEQTVNPWRLFFRGNEYPIDAKDLLIEHLHLEQLIENLLKECDDLLNECTNAMD